MADASVPGQLPDLAGRIGRLGDRLAGARRLSHESQVREALTRNELSLSLAAALAARDEALAAVRKAALKRYLGAVQRLPVRRASPTMDRLLLRLPGGAARLVARAAAPAALIDGPWYLDTYPDVARSGLSPAVHYLLKGAAEGRRPHPLFDPEHYLRQASPPPGISPLEHYARQGAAAGLSPHPLFDLAHYLAQGAEPEPGEDALSHYLRSGWVQGLSPHPLFDPKWYRRQLPAEAAAVPPLAHYVTAGWRLGLSPHPLFEPAWYLAQYPDVAEAGFEPLTHFLALGGEEGRDPCPWFDVPYYKVGRGEARQGCNPLVDYLQGGAWAVAEARPGFATAAYLAAVPQLARQGMTPLEDWARRHSPLPQGEAERGRGQGEGGADPSTGTAVVQG